VLLDTEGIDSYDQTGHYSAQVFCLALLLSSVFVYNQMGGIDEAALDRLALVTEMTRLVRVRAASASASSSASAAAAGAGGGGGGGGGGGEAAALAELRAFTPAFVWLLRDFYLRLEGDDGRAVRAGGGCCGGGVLCWTVGFCLLVC
jgi:hypothetical protein